VRAAARSASATARTPLQRSHLLQYLLCFIGKTQGIGVHFLHNKPWRSPCLFHLLGHEFDGLQGIAQPFAHCLTHGHAGSVSKTPEGRMHLWRDSDRKPYRLDGCGGGRSHGAFCTRLHQFSRRAIYALLCLVNLHAVSIS
jgi:hypothetical protein